MTVPVLDPLRTSCCLWLGTETWLQAADWILAPGVIQKTGVRDWSKGQKESVEVGYHGRFHRRHRLPPALSSWKVDQATPMGNKLRLWQGATKGNLSWLWGCDVAPTVSFCFIASCSFSELELKNVHLPSGMSLYLFSMIGLCFLISPFFTWAGWQPVLSLLKIYLKGTMREGQKETDWSSSTGSLPKYPHSWAQPGQSQELHLQFPHG